MTFDICYLGEAWMNWPGYFLVNTKYDIWYLLFGGGMDELAWIFPGKYKIWYLISVIWGEAWMYLQASDWSKMVMWPEYWPLIGREWSGHVTWILGSYWPKRDSPNFYFQIITRNIGHISSNYQKYWAYF